MDPSHIMIGITTLHQLHLLLSGTVKYAPERDAIVWSIKQVERAHRRHPGKTTAAAPFGAPPPLCHVYADVLPRVR